MKKTPAKVTIRSVLEEIRKLLSFAEGQILEIHEYYNVTAVVKTVRSPMDIYRNYPGGNDLSGEASLLHHNAFILGRDFYYSLCREFWNDDNVLHKLTNLKTDITNMNLCAMSFAKQRINQARERGQDVALSPVADIFYMPFQRFITNLDIVTNRLRCMEIDPKDWDNQIRLIFTNHARKLIHEGKMTPEVFQIAVDESCILNLDEQCKVSFDYIYSLSKFFSLIAGPTSVDFKNGKPVFYTPYFSSDKLIEKFVEYLVTKVKTPDMLKIFQEVFNQCYLEEVELPRQQRALSKLTRNGREAGMSSRFWISVPEDHRVKMESVFKELIEKFGPSL